MRFKSRQILWALLVVLASAAVSFYASQFAIDLSVYHPITRYVFSENGPSYMAESGLPWPMWYRYPLLFLFAFWPFALLPFRVSAFVWTMLKCGVLAGLFRAVESRTGKISRQRLLLAACIALPYAVTEFRYANVQFFIFAMVAAALLAAEKRRWYVAPLLGFAISLKVWPLFFVPYLAVSRRKLEAAGSLAAAGFFTLLPALHFGWTEYVHRMSRWYQQEFSIAGNAVEIWFPSQSLLGLMGRFLTEVSYQNLPDGNYPVVNLMALDPVLVRVIWMAAVVAGSAGLWWLASRPWNLFRLEMHALAFCALVLLQPYSQKQSALVVLVLPALVVAANFRCYPVLARRWLYAAAGLGALQPLFGHSQRLLLVLGADTLIILLVAVALVAVVRKLPDSHQSLPTPASTSPGTPNDS